MWSPIASPPLHASLTSEQPSPLWLLMPLSSCRFPSYLPLITAAWYLSSHRFCGRSMLWLSRSFSCCPSPSSCWLELIADGSDRPKLSTNSSSEKEGEARQCGRMAWALGMPYASAALLHGWWWWRQKQLREERGGHGHPIRCLGAHSSPLRVSSLWQAWEGEEKGMVTLNAGLWGSRRLGLWERQR